MSLTEQERGVLTVNEQRLHDLYTTEHPDTLLSILPAKIKSLATTRLERDSAREAADLYREAAMQKVNPLDRDAVKFHAALITKADAVMRRGEGGS